MGKNDWDSRGKAKNNLVWVRTRSPTGFPMIPDALCDGLLYVVVLCGTVGRLNTDLTMLVKNVLSSSLTSYGTVSIIGDSLVSVKKFADHPAFHSSTLFPHGRHLQPSLMGGARCSKLSTTLSKGGARSATTFR
jgi:hypothetical protein